MKPKEIRLPSNKNFGIFLSTVFFISSLYFYIKETYNTSFILGFIVILLVTITYFKASILRPLNKLWMNLGMLLSILVRPIVMGAIFFLIFTPISISMRLFRRDELHLLFKKKFSYWINRNNSSQTFLFKNQF
jgi:hypothetical protein|tara:strand:- start:634 stop:1032 length:399 start_codon:yes stop_codon:yes gene_type:complete